MAEISSEKFEKRCRKKITLDLRESRRRYCTSRQEISPGGKNLGPDFAAGTSNDTLSGRDFLGNERRSFGLELRGSNLAVSINYASRRTSNDALVNRESVVVADPLSNFYSPD